MYIDTHCHLDDERFSDDLIEVISRSEAAGFECIITVGTNPDSNIKALEIAESHEIVKAVIGIDRYHANEVNDDSLKEIENMTSNQNVVAIGEIGLDYFHMEHPKETQMSAFEKQLSLAEKIGLPVVIHTRDAHQDTLHMLRKYKGCLKGIIHCFNGNLDVMREYIALGYLISIAGHVTFKKATILREALAELPVQNLVFETDAPYLTPEPFRGKRNEPKYMIETIKYYAEMIKMPPAEIATISTNNAKSVFNLK